MTGCHYRSKLERHLSVGQAALSGTGDRYTRFYTFTLDEAADVTITLESDEDTYLYLLEGHGRNGTVLYEEDDIDLSL